MRTLRGTPGSVVPKLSLLFSYTFLRRHPFTCDVVRRLSPDVTDILIDSGAFSDWGVRIRAAATGVPAREPPTHLGDYIRYCRTLPPHAEYISLDVIADPARSLANWQTMRDAGLHPIGVWVMGESLDRLHELIAANPRVGVAAATIIQAEDKQQRILTATAIPGAKVHALGYTRWPSVAQLGVTSCDSINWMGGGMFGSLSRFGMTSGVQHLTTRKLSDADPSWYRHLLRCGYTPADLANPATWRGVGRNVLIATGAHAYMQLWAACAAHGVRYHFVAINGSSDFLSVLFAMRAAFRGAVFDLSAYRTAHRLLRTTQAQARAAVYAALANEYCAQPMPATLTPHQQAA